MTRWLDRNANLHTHSSTSSIASCSDIMCGPLSLLHWRPNRSAGPGLLSTSPSSVKSCKGPARVCVHNILAGTNSVHAGCVDNCAPIGSSTGSLRFQNKGRGNNSMFLLTDEDTVRSTVPLETPSTLSILASGCVGNKREGDSTNLRCTAG